MITVIKDFLIERIDPSFIILFGSYATGCTHSESDVDIAFCKEFHSLSAYDVFILARELAITIDRHVDLIDLDEASTVFKAQVFNDGKAIYVKHQHMLDEYRMRALSMYAQLNEERFEIIEGIYKRGSIYEKRGYSE